MSKSNVYVGTWSDERWYEVTVNGIFLDPRLDLVYHSPTGLAWGYGGSGPSQTALAILAYEYNSSVAREYYMRFKERFVAGLPVEGNWTATSADIEVIMHEMGVEV